jgi:hypothetical protein
MTLCACAIAPPGAAAEELPLVHVVYEGKTENTSTYSGKQTGEVKETLEWSATAESDSAGNPSPVTFTSVSGSRSATTTENHDTVCLSATYSLNPAMTVVSDGWYLQTVDGFPAPGWKYEIPDTVNEVPYLENWQFTCGGPGSGKAEYAPGVQEFYDGLTAGLCEFSNPEIQGQEAEKLFAPLFLTPGGGGESTRKYHPPECVSTPGETTFHISVTTTLTTKVLGTPISTEHQPEAKHEETKQPSEPPERKRLEEIRARIKLLAIEDEIKAFESMTEIRNEIQAGVGSLGDLNALLGEYVYELERFTWDSEIADDPAVPSYETLAQPEAVKGRALPACNRRSRTLASCQKLRAAAAKMLASAADAASIDHALAVTLDRQTAAIDAGSLSAAANQAAHFEALHTRFESALASKRDDGAALAKLLRERNVKGNVSKAEDAAAIAAVEAKLAKAGVPGSRLAAELGSALVAHKTNFLRGLEQGLG